ncbi:tyrosine-protein kinase family protein [Cohnella candidum]|uniref:ParA family protein n=1 Tax=Cohnella candidum TaxID=2674991 RepID=A0A3G3K3Z4_9BACL|nr:AAA family ATPase [Cohnella candidum]AYQ74757.1 ParA family protein [Cohnella candidum]
MNSNRKRLTEFLSERYVSSEREWIELEFSPTGLLNITIVSDYFSSMNQSERMNDLIQLLDTSYEFGFIYIFTVNEAKELDITRTSKNVEGTPKSWGDLASMVQNEDEQTEGIDSSKNSPDIRTVAFYSYKGGVGRTTALVHVAAILAKRGNKVLIVDLDLEAPSLHMLFKKLSPEPTSGMVDYLYERAYTPANKYNIHISNIIGEMHLENAPGRLFVIPAGTVDYSYITKVDDLRVAALRDKKIWNTFLYDVNEQLHPDIILIDSRTGINEWGAFSLLEAADDIILCMYPNEENYEGLSLISDGLKLLENNSNKTINFVLTKVPSNKDGKKRADVYWEKVRVSLNNYEEDTNDTYSDTDGGEPVVIYYNADIALSETYPIEHLFSVYAPVANLIDEGSEQNKLKVILSGTNRWKIIESLVFESVDAKDEKNDLGKVFQRTSDFDKFIDENTAVIHGQKGTGKTALYWMLLKYSDNAKAIAKGRLDRITPISGHGHFSARPGKEEFRYMYEKLGEKASWEAVWRAYSVLRLYMENKLPPFRNNKYEVIYQALKKVGKRNDIWSHDHTLILISLSSDIEKSILIKDYMQFLNDEFKKKEQITWLLYDDLDEDIQERSAYQNDVLSGLFYFVRSVDAQKLSNIKFKIFIREDIWDRINFTNKSHFNGRDVLLQWSRIDFLRLALRQSFYSSQYKELVDKFFPVQEIDHASEEAILDALQILWGIRREKNRNSKYVGRWVHERLTDASGTTFPRVLGLLLSAAKDHEMQYINQAHVPAPSDRLLRSQSLNAGLISAAKHRSQELREEYPDLVKVFDSLSNFSELCGKKDIETIYKECYKPMDRTLDDFIATLKNIGLVSEDYVKGEIQYRFADMYVHGFGMKRSHGRKL